MQARLAPKIALTDVQSTVRAAIEHDFGYAARTND